MYNPIHPSGTSNQLHNKKRKHHQEKHRDKIHLTQDTIESMYKAAGIIPMSIDEDGDVCLLVFQESRSSHGKKKLHWIDAGGRRETYDKTSWDTAFRELNEETGSFFSHNVLPEMVIRKIWIQRSRYVAYVVYLPYDHNISHKYLSNQQFYPELKSVQWIKLKDLFQVRFDNYYQEIPLHIRFRHTLLKL
jgi:8-oxo-dGTP pyrophosphatase MutT (NUDIX family)